MSAFKYFTMIKCPCRCVPQLSHESECEGLLPDCRIDEKESDSEDDSSWMRWQHTWKLTFWSNYGMSLMIMWQGRLWVTDSRMHGGEVWRLAWPLIHRIPLLAHGLTVKRSPGPCGHSSLAGQIGACQHVGHLCLCGHLKCNLLLTHLQARLRIMQHLSSSHMRIWTTVECIWLTQTRIPPTLEKF